MLACYGDLHKNGPYRCMYLNTYLKGMDHLGRIMRSGLIGVDVALLEEAYHWEET